MTYENEKRIAILDLPKIREARLLMVKAHQGQTRWLGEPYQIHPQKVVETLVKMEVYVEHILIAAYLHDTLEDTDLEACVIENIFGVQVLKLVKELTFEDSSKDDQIYWDQVSKLSNDAKIIKMADIYANLTDNKKQSPSPHFIEKRIKALMIINESLLDYWR